MEEKKILVKMIEGTRWRGRPRCRWEDKIRNDKDIKNEELWDIKK